MSHYEQRLENDLNRIRDHVKALAKRAEEATKNAVHALLTGNEKLAYATILADNPINRAMRELDKLCHGFIALHLPSAGHLRFISAVIRTTIELERIGDYAVTICRESVQLSHIPDGMIAREIELLSGESLRMLHQAVVAFDEGNAEAARATMLIADQVERTFDTMFAELLREEGQGHWSMKDLFALLVIFNMLERVSDQAKNICEDTVFAVTGETKAKKVYRVMFLDEDNSCQSQMAEAIARKSFPNSGRYSSAGRQAASLLNQEMLEFLDQRGLNISEAESQALDLSPQELSDLHVIVSLQGAVKNYVPQIPFHTSALEWDVGSIPEGLEPAERQRRFEEMYRELALQIRDLMETLRGEEAS